MSRNKRKKISLPRNARWACDFDYLHKLDAKQRAFLDKFIDEYYNGSVKKGDKTALHSTDKLRKDAYRRKNAVNADLYSISACVGLVTQMNEQTYSQQYSTPDDLKRRQALEDYADKIEADAKKRRKS